MFAIATGEDVMKLIAFGLVITTWGAVQAQDSFFFRKDNVVSQQEGAGFVGGPTVVGDFNGDGRMDVGICTSIGPTILLNRGNAVLSAPVSSRNSCGSVAADFDGDGRADLVNANHLVLSRGDGTFLPPLVIGPPGISPRIVALGDFNGDRRPDLVFYTGPTGWDETVAPTKIHVFLGVGDAAFQESWVFEHPPERGLGVAILADLNRDNRADIVVPDGDGVIAFLGRGNGSFDGPRRSKIGEASTFIVAADFNGDGHQDIATATSVALGTGNGSFAAGVRHPGTEVFNFFGPPLSIIPSAAADFDGDGRIDLAGSAFSLMPFPSEVWVLRGQGDGTLLPPSRIAVGTWPQPPAVADFDGDGRVDLAVNGSVANTLSLLFARPPATPGLRRAVSAASGRAIVSPGSLATLFAPGLATMTQQATAPWPSRLGGIGLEVRDSAGTTRAAPLLLVSSNQINFQTPEGTAVGEAVLSIVNERGTTQVGSMQVEAVAPALFVIPLPFLMPRAAATAVRIEPDGSQTHLPLLDCSADSCFPKPLPEPDARPIYISLYGTGFTAAGRSRVTCAASGMPVEVTYAGPQTVPGLDQVNVRLPLGQPGLGTVVCTIDGVVTNAVSL
jgi:uncharacterized protein (TIGR03437 family)